MNKVKSFYRLEVICGPMFSGKTEELIRRVKRLKYSNTDYIVFKPKIDTRYSEFSVVTHDRVSLTSFTVDSAQQILEACDNNPQVRVIAIDEAQFFLKEESTGPNLLAVCQHLKAKGYRVIVNGLDMDYLGRPFGLMPELMAIADEVSKLKSVCAVCGSEASMTYHMNKTDESQVELGSEDKYQARCFEHWVKGEDSTEE